ncbi:MAG TPA: flagellar biosynthetic protein FliO [Acidimicrobiales bacterium]|nr:flagellar biosynthetic protein FliO [Acidimicrobiales bacterium]
MGATFLAFVRMILALGLVVGVLVVLARFARRFQDGGRSDAKSMSRIDVVSRRSLGKHGSLLVVQVGSRILLVGHSAQQMTLLGELDRDEWVKTDSSTSQDRLTDQLLTPRTVLSTGGDSPGAWDAFVDHLREMTVRR